MALAATIRCWYWSKTSATRRSKMVTAAARYSSGPSWLDLAWLIWPRIERGDSFLVSMSNSRQTISISRRESASS